MEETELFADWTLPKPVGTDTNLALSEIFMNYTVTYFRVIPDELLYYLCCRYMLHP
jgi:hypothetical protein